MAVYEDCGHFDCCDMWIHAGKYNPSTTGCACGKGTWRLDSLKDSTSSRLLSTHFELHQHWQSLNQSPSSPVPTRGLHGRESWRERLLSMILLNRPAGQRRGETMAAHCTARKACRHLTIHHYGCNPSMRGSDSHRCTSIKKTFLL